MDGEPLTESDTLPDGELLIEAEAPDDADGLAEEEPLCRALTCWRKVIR